MRRGSSWFRAAVIAALVGGPVVLSSTPLAAQQSNVGFETITVDQLAGMLKDKDFAFVNVHVPYEGEIAGTDDFIPFDEVAANLDRLPADKAASIVLYCRSGRMSEIAAAKLAELGYSNVSHVAGGFVAWAAAGYPIETRKDGAGQ